MSERFNKALARRSRQIYAPTSKKKLGGAASLLAGGKETDDWVSSGLDATKEKEDPVHKHLPCPKIRSVHLNPGKVASPALSRRKPGQGFRKRKIAPH
ncbi:hypothetical protein [Acanthopleuribacter pedis]|uniref:hypothetical protein n=1 Tax=Acanthopleuribacter pedis TaxID=442870 RepID=UPI001A9DB6DE|nr:hypothetical protein [Acanthopleuribacter pedis]